MRLDFDEPDGFTGNFDCWEKDSIPDYTIEVLPIKWVFHESTDDGEATITAVLG